MEEMSFLSDIKEIMGLLAYMLLFVMPNLCLLYKILVEKCNVAQIMLLHPIALDFVHALMQFISKRTRECENGFISYSKRSRSARTPAQADQSCPK